MKRILILGAPIFQIPVVQKAKEMGLWVGIVDINADAPAFAYADECFTCSIRDVDGVLAIAKKFKPDGIVIGACDTSVVTGARVCKELGLPGNTVEAALNSTDKGKMIQAFEAHGVAHPFFRIVKKEEIANFSVTLPYPIISKPVDSAGSRGIRIIHEESELRDALLFSSQAGLSGNIIVEEYMRGPEVSVEVLVTGGVPHVLQITDKITSGEPFFYETGHSQPSALPEDTKRKIRDLASAAVLAVGLTDSTAHVEIKVTDEGPKMVELGSRLGGDYITSYLLENSVYGISLTRSAIELALGLTPDASRYYDCGSVAVRFIPAKKGVIKAIYGVDDVKKDSDVIAFDIIGKIGERYSDAASNSARFGAVVCRGTTTRDALEHCQRIIDHIFFEMEN